MRMSVVIAIECSKVTAARRILLEEVSTRLLRLGSWMLFVSLALSGAPLSAQQGTLSGRVIDAEDGTAVADANIEVRGQALGATDAEGGLHDVGSRPAATR